MESLSHVVKDFIKTTKKDSKFYRLQCTNYSDSRDMIIHGGKVYLNKVFNMQYNISQNPQPLSTLVKDGIYSVKELIDDKGIYNIA